MAGRGGGAWQQQLGYVSEVLLFWSTQISELALRIDQTVWVENVLPGLGYDRVRLIEIDLGCMPGEDITAERFSRAVREFDEGRYENSVVTCRNIRNAWERTFGATRQRPVATILGEQLGWPEGDWHRTTLDALWRSFADLTNTAHHPVQDPPPLPFTAADAKLCLQLTLTLSEYVGHARRETVGGL